MDEKKKKESLSWIDEILSGEEDPLEKILKKKGSGKKEPENIPIPTFGSSSLEDILAGGSKSSPEQPEPKEKKPEAVPSTGADLLAQLLGEEESKKESGAKAPAPEQEKREVASHPAAQKPSVEAVPTGSTTGVDLLTEILGGSEVSTREPLGGPSSTQKTRGVSPEKLFGTPAVEESPSYAGRAEVLDVYGNVRIIKVKGEPVPIYELRFPKLSKEEEQLFRRIKDRAITEIQLDPTAIPNPEERRKFFIMAVKKMLKEEAPHYSEGRIEVLAEMIVQQMVGYGKLDSLVRDDNLEEIMVIGTNRPVYVWHRRFNMCKTNIVFDNEKEILNIIERIAREVGRRIDQQSPLLDARLPDGSRVNATIPPISLDGPTITIRKFKKDPLTIIDLIKYGTMSSEVAAFLWLLVDGLGVKPANILVSGGTGSGKTTTLNSIAMFIPPSERVISIEDTAELQLPVEHWVRLETRPPNLEGKGEVTMDDLVRNTLRMRPDRIIVGEVRGPEARTMFTAMNTGHDGCMGTLHANSARETIVRLESPPMNVPRIMIPALDIILIQVRFHSRKKGTLRRVTEVAEVSGLEGESIQLNTLYKYDPAKDELVSTGVPSRTINILAQHTGMSVKEIMLEIEKRRIILEWMVEKGIRGIDKVGYYIRQFYIDEEWLLNKISADSDMETSKQIQALI
ncbi:flagellar protein FlaI [Thermococcus stetteri]|nr:CpaF family protein [Thermococcus stetteri]MBP1911529.1 flagellar protein FlaI [Thermococcus stetteri]